MRAGITTTYSNEVFPPPPSFGPLSYQLRLAAFHLLMACANMWLRTTSIAILFVELYVFYLIRNMIFFDPVKKTLCTGASPVVLPHYVHDVYNHHIGLIYQLPFLLFHLIAGGITTRPMDVMPFQNAATIALHSCLLVWLIAYFDKKVSGYPLNIICPFILALFLANPDPNLYLGVSHMYDLNYPAQSFVVAVWSSVAASWVAWTVTLLL